MLPATSNRRRLLLAAVTEAASRGDRQSAANLARALHRGGVVVTPETVRGYLDDLVSDGAIEVIDRGGRGRAAVYRVRQ